MRTCKIIMIFVVIFITTSCRLSSKVSEAKTNVDYNLQSKDENYIKNRNKNLTKDSALKEASDQVYERLKKQYPIDWFYNRFGIINFSGTGFDLCDYKKTKGSQKICAYFDGVFYNGESVEDFIESLSVDEIISIFVNRKDLSLLEDSLVASINMVKNKPDNIKYKEVRKFLNSLDYLMINNRGCEIFDIVNPDLWYYRDMVLRNKISNDHGVNFKCISKSFRDDKDFSLRYFKVFGYDDESFMMISQRLKNDEEVLNLVRDNEVAMFISLIYPESVNYHKIDFMSPRLQKKFKDIWLPENKDKFSKMMERIKEYELIRQENKELFNKK